MDNVELYNMSQKDTENAAVRFEGVFGRPSSLTNCALHHGLNWGVKVWNSENITISGNSIFYFLRIGVTLDGVTNVIFHDNLVGRVIERTVNEERGGVLACTFK